MVLISARSDTSRTMPESLTVGSTYSVDTDDVVQCVVCCPYDWVANLVAVATKTRVSILSCRFPQEDSELEDVATDTVREFHQGCRVTGLSWSPQTSLQTAPRVLKFCTAGGDHKLRLFTSDLKDDDTINVLGEHHDYINAVSIHPDRGEHVASVSDDLTCRVWTTTDSAELACFPLTSPGMGVCWHAEQPAKLLVGEKSGVIRIYNYMSQQPIMSLDCASAPLCAVDWCPGNSNLVAAVVGADWLIFDTSRSSRPLETKGAHAGGCTVVKWSRSHDHLLATAGRPHHQIKVFNARSGQTSLSKNLLIASGLSWHYRLPLVAVGGDKKVHFFIIEPM